MSVYQQEACKYKVFRNCNFIIDQKMMLVINKKKQIPKILSCLSFLSGNQTNWWWFGHGGVDGNPRRFVQKNKKIIIKNSDASSRVINHFLLCPVCVSLSGPWLAARYQKPLQRCGGLAGTRER